MTCTCSRQADRFVRPVVVGNRLGQLFLLVGGMAISPADVEIVAVEGKIGKFVRATVPTCMVELMSWDELVARRAAKEPATQRPHLRADGIPTRCDRSLMSRAELVITQAMYAVEEAGGSEKLTEATTLLSQALDCVADHVEKKQDDAMPSDA